MKTAIALSLALCACSPIESSISDAIETRPALLVLLHAYNQTTAQLDAKLYVSYLYTGTGLAMDPPGTLDVHGKSAFNASHSCCDDSLSNPDEATIVSAVNTRIAVGDVDPNRVYAIGLSNGGFMATRLGCDHADLFAGIADLSGAGQSANDAACSPSMPVAVLHVHGTADATVSYTTPGYLSGMPDQYVAAATTLSQSIAANACSGTTTTTTSARDIDFGVAGYETDTIAADGCPSGAAVELWRMNGSVHMPTYQTWIMTTLVNWLDAHNRNGGPPSTQHISDAVYTPGTAGFYFLPALVPSQPSPPGTFDATLKPRLTIAIYNLDCVTWSVGSVAGTFTNVLMYSSIMTYRVTGNVPTLGLVADHCYRVAPRLDGIDLGLRDVMVTAHTPIAGLMQWSPNSNQTLQFTMYH